MKRLTQIPDELSMDVAKANELAAICRVTPEEIQVLFQGERCDITSRTGERVWQEAERLAKGQMVGEVSDVRD